MSDDQPVRICAAQPVPPCTCGHRGICTMCVLVEEFGFETALTVRALEVTERACGLEGAKQ